MNTGSSPSAQGRPFQNGGNDPNSVLRINEAGRMILAEVIGPLDAESTPGAVARLLSHAAPSRRLVLDLRRAAFVDSDGIRGLLSLEARTRQAGAELRLVAQPGGQVHKVLGMLRLDCRFEIFSSVVDAWITRWNDQREADYRQRQAA